MMSVAYICLALAVMSYVFTPLFKPQKRLDERSRRADRRRQLLEERERVYASIRDLDFDYRTGKVEEPDYRSSRQELTANAVQVLKQLDEVEVSGGKLEDRLEEEIAGARRKKGPKGSARPCPSCGTRAPAGARFCSSCGSALEAA